MIVIKEGGLSLTDHSQLGLQPGESRINSKPMNLRPFLALACLGGAFFSFSFSTEAQVGPFDPGSWPGTAKADKAVHFVTVPTEGLASLEPLSDSWIQGGMTLLSGGDQSTTDLTIGGFSGKRTTDNYFNVADRDYVFWNDYGTLDILMQVYGDSGVLAANGNPRNFNFLIGTLPGSNLLAPLGGSLPIEAKNQKWNWVLFRIDNSFFDVDAGFRHVGTKHPEAPGGSDAGGVNGGTIRLEGIKGLAVRVVAWGEEGAFGEPGDVNLFLPPEGCDPEPETNLASIDIASGRTDHIQVLSGGDQQTILVEGVGPEGDKRKAVLPVGSLMNFAVTDHYLGAVCNEPHSVKVCVDYYDDPALVGTDFGPEAYASDAKGAIAFVPATQRQVLAGTGQWIRRSWIVPGVSLFGVNAAPLTAGPRFAFGGPVAISRYALAVFRVGNHPLAGVDPLADCLTDPLVCTDAYGKYVDMDLASGNLNGLAPGDSGGDQVYIQEEAGPANDIRMAIRPALHDVQNGFANEYLNFKITGQALGPNSQSPARLAICVTYFDSAESAGKQFRPEVYWTEQNGILGLAFTPGSIYKTLEGSDTWREAYFELPDVKFNGVNQGPQAAARFHLTGKVYFSRVQYGVISPCGPNAGVNPLEACKGVRLNLSKQAAGKLRFSWPINQTGYSLESSETLGPDATWVPSTEVPTVDAKDFVILLNPAGTRYYRLSK